MVKQFNYDAFGHLEYPDIILSTRYHKHLGRIKTIDYSTLNSNFNMNVAQEISFDIYKKFNNIECDNWDDIIDLKYIYIPEYKEYYCIEVTTNDTDKTVKQITGKSACEYELSNRKLYNFECNTESDILRDDYVPTIICNPDNHNASLLHRVIKDKCPDYTIGHVDESIAKLQRTFSANDKDIYSFLTGDVAKEVECLFVFDSVNRTISCYDLKTYGENTGVHISVENYADEISISGNPDSRFNCMKVSGGDDLMTATVANINPNGTNYIYNFSEDMLADMPSELVDRINTYNTLYNSLQPTYIDYANKLYELIDRLNYLKSEMMPEIVIPTTTAQQEGIKLKNELTLVEVQNINSLSKASSDSAVKGMANVIVDTRYDIEITSSSLSGISNNARVWRGTIKITNQGNEDDTVTTNELLVSIRSDDYEKYTYQRIQKLLSRKDTVFVDIFDIEDINIFKSELKKYCLDRLQSFESSYQGCLDVLIEQGVTDGNTSVYGVNLYESMYKPYRERMALVQAEMVVRENEISSVQNEYDNYNGLKIGIQEQLSFKKYIGDDLWLIFMHYLQEDTYANDNYISEGLSDSELIEKANELFERAKEEIQKACEPQYSLTSTLQNLFHRKDFEKFRDKVALGNWINLVADDEIYKLRLLNLSFQFGSLDKISVSFSNVEKVKNVISDTESVLSQAKSIAGSFNYVAHQASQGNDANTNIKNWMTDGLNSALVQIKNNDNEEITYDEHGLLARSYDDVTDLYSPEQLKITHNVLCFTKDDWLTTSLAIGKHDYIYYDEADKSFKTATDFGVSASFLQAGYIYGSQIISGDIYSDNYSEIDNTGSHLNLRDGTFSYAGGALTWDGTTLLISSPSIPTITQITQITKDTITTAYIDALNITAKSVSTDWVYTGNIIADQIKTGSIVSTNGYTNINLDDGTFSMAGGALKWDGENFNVKGIFSFYSTIYAYFYGDDAFHDIKGFYPVIDKTTEGIKFGLLGLDGGDSSICFNTYGFYIKSFGNTIIGEEYGMGGYVFHYRNSVFDKDVNIQGTLYTTSGTVSTSDRDMKNSISVLDIDKSAQFIYSLNPTQYKYNDGNSNRFHHGFIAQEVKECMGDDDWGVYVDTSVNNKQSEQSESKNCKALRYDELIADIVATIQSQHQRIIELEKVVKILNG